jgi:hypothetical protein
VRVGEHTERNCYVVFTDDYLVEGDDYYEDVCINVFNVNPDVVADTQVVMGIKGGVNAGDWARHPVTGRWYQISLRGAYESASDGPLNGGFGPLKGGV